MTNENNNNNDVMPEIKEKSEKVSKRKKVKKVVSKKRFWFFLAVALVSSFFLWYYFTSFESTDDAFVEAHIVKISPKIQGIVQKLYIDDNQHVKKGELLLQIDDRDYKVRYEQAKAAYEIALHKQKSAIADRASADIDLKLAQDDLARYENLFNKGAVSKQELDKPQSKYETTRAKYEAAEQNVFSKQKNKVADADLKRLEALMEQAKLDLSYTKIYAPEDGKITNRAAEEGAYTHIGSPLFSIVPDKRWIVANYKETQLERIRPNQEVEIKVDAYPHLKLKGKVDSIQASTGAKTSMFPPENAVGSYVKVVQRVPVKIVFTDKIDPQYSIEPGMSVIPKVLVRK